MLLVLLVGGALFVSLATDVGRYAAQWRRVASVADAAATAGATELDEEAAYDDRIVLDRDAARDTARRVADTGDRRVVVTATRREVCVTVRETFAPGIIRWAGVSERTVQHTSCASPIKG